MTANHPPFAALAGQSLVRSQRCRRQAAAYRPYIDPYDSLLSLARAGLAVQIQARSSH